MSFKREKSQRNAFMLTLKQWMDKVKVYWITNYILSAGKWSRNIANSNFIIRFSSIVYSYQYLDITTHTTYTCTVNEVWFRHKEEVNPVIYDNMDEMEAHFAKWNKSSTERQTLYMWKLKGGKAKLIDIKRMVVTRCWG